MEVIQTSPPPSLGGLMRRRKKRVLGGGTSSSSGGGSGSILIPGTTNIPPGSASTLTGLNRNSIRLVELTRGKVGYGFTISGQKPCLLRGIVDESPASSANLRPGNCLVGVNGRDVSHLAHDEVVALIGKCTGLLRLHVTDSYFSESSDEETLQINQPRPKYQNRMRSSTAHSKSALSKRSSTSNSNDDQFDSSEKRLIQKKSAVSTSPPPPPPHSYTHNTVQSCLDTRRAGSTTDPTTDLLIMGEESPIPALPCRIRSSSKMVNPAVSSVRVFSTQEEYTNRKMMAHSTGPFPTNNSSRSGGGKSTHHLNNMRRTITNSSCNNVLLSNPSDSSCISSNNTSLPPLNSSCLYQAVVGYVGSAELPLIEEHKRLQALTTCIRRLRVERRMRSIVLLRIQPNGISLFGSNQNALTGPPLAFYSSAIISFCGAYNEDRRFFGLVTCTNSSKQLCSCHVFMVDPKLLSHSDHSKRARTFGFSCTGLPVPKYGQVLGLQECVEFPATADPVLSSILQLHGLDTPTSTSQRSPSEASTRLESTNSSNSDSGVGFRDDCDRNSGSRIYDIAESEIGIMFEHSNDNNSHQLHHHHSRHRSPPRIRYHQTPHSHPHHAKGASFFNCPPNCVECRDDISSSSISGSVSLPDGNNSRDHSNNNTFQPDPLSLQEILQSSNNNSNTSSPRRISSSQNNVPHHHHIEVVSVVVTPHSEHKQEQFISSADKKKSPTKTKLCASRSLDNLCSPDVFNNCNINNINKKKQQSSSSSSYDPPVHQIGSTPTLNKEVPPPPLPTTSIISGNGSASSLTFREFKVPRPPKPKREMNRVESWAENIENLLADQCGRHVFTEFLQHEFSAENILFYNACVRYKKVYPNLTECQRISLASTIFQRYVQNGATDPVNVDFQARSQAEKLLPHPTPDMFDLPLGQVYNLLKFDCYPRFLRSDMYRDYSTGAVALPLSQYDDTSDSDQDSIKSHKLDSDGGRRRSLLPWNIKNRSKNKHKSKDDPDRLNSDISFIQRTAITQNAESSDTDDSRRQSYKLCRVTLPDNSTTVLPCKPGESLSIVVQRLLEKREFHYAAFEVVNVATGKALDLNMEASEMTAKEIRVEPRSFIGIELPKGWKVGVRANPFRKVAEVLKPILSQHSLKLDSVVVYDIDTEERIDIKMPMARLDGHNLLVKTKDSQLEEITNHVGDGVFDPTRFHDDDDDDDLVSTKTGSSQSSSVFRGFLRRSSKFKQRKGNKSSKQQSGSQGSVDLILTKDNNMLTSNSSLADPPSHDENFHPHHQNRLITQLRNTNDSSSSTPISSASSPLSLVSAELKLPENSRNRKPIYVGQKNNGNNNDSES